MQAMMESVIGSRQKSGDAYTFGLTDDHIDVLRYCTSKARTNEQIVLELGVNQARAMELRDAGLLVQEGYGKTLRGNSAKAFRTTDAGLERVLLHS